MDKRKDIIRKIYDFVVKRSDKLCNFVEEKRYAAKSILHV